MLALLLVAAQSRPEFERPFRVRDAQGEIEIDAGGAAPCVADVDGDGLADLLVGRSDGRVELRRNVGTRERPRFEVATLVQTDGVDARVQTGDGIGFTPCVGDVTGDGLADLVTGSGYTDSAWVFAGRGDGTFAAATKLFPFPTTGPLVDQGSATALGDFDRDGDLDLLTTDLGGETRLRVNLASARAPARFDAGVPLRAGGKELALDWGGAGVLFDWNGDGLVDLVAGAWDGSIVVYAAKRAGEFDAPVTLLAAPAEPAVLVPDASGRRWSVFAQRSQTGARPCVADWNGDGRLDLIVGDDVYLKGPEPVLAPERAQAKRELETLLRELDARSVRTWSDLRATLLRSKNLREDQLSESEVRRNAFEAEFERALEEAPVLRALRTSKAAVRAELELLSAPVGRRSTVWVYLQGPHPDR